MKKVTSVTEASLFRSVSVVIIFSVCITIFLFYTQELSKKANQISREKVITELNLALSMVLFQSTITGSLKGMADLDQKNPFIALRGKDYKPPLDYVGQLKPEQVLGVNGWYFDESRKNIFYWDGKNRSYSYQLQFKYHDINHNDEFDPASDVIEGLKMVEL